MKRTIIIATSVLLWTSISLNGVNQGFDLAIRSDVGIYDSGGTGYTLLANCYFMIACLAGGMRVAQLSKSLNVGLYLTIGLTILSIYPFSVIYRQRSLILSNGSWPSLLQHTYVLDWTVVACACFVLIMSIAALIASSQTFRTSESATLGSF